MNPQNYTPLAQGQAPGLGTSGAAVGALQTAYNNNPTNQNNPNFVPLKVDSLYGPKTQAALNPNQLVVNGGNAGNEFNQNSGNLAGLLAQHNQVPTKATPTVGNTNDAYTQMLDRLGSTSDLANKALISTIQAQRSQRGATINAQYDNYKRGLQMLGIQHNEAQSTPDLLMGHIQQAENEHQAKLGALDVEMNKALIDAQSAKDNKDLGTLKEKMSYVKQLKQEQQDELKNIADQMNYQTKIAESQAGQYYDAMQKLDPKDQEAFLQAVAKKFNLPLGTLVESIAKEKERRDTLDLERRGKESIIKSRNKTGGTPTFKVSQGIAKVTPQMEAIKGPDGYIDPQKWIEARTAWNSLGGTDASFKTSFLKYLNPLSYEKAGFKAPGGSVVNPFK